MLTIPRDLNVYSSGMPPIISLSQYDSDFQLVFNLYTSEGTLNIPSGTTAQIQGTKRDGNGYSASATISGNTVTVTGHNQMTACAGANIYEISLTNSGKVLNTINFILAVEPAAMDAGTIQSETVLKELQAIIDSAATSTQAAQDAEDAADRAEEAARSLTVDPTLTQSGQPADAKVTGDEINDLKADIDEIEPLSEDAKTALLNCFAHVAWVDEHGQDYYDALEAALYPETGLVSITAVFDSGSNVIYDNTPLNDLKAYLTVTGHYSDGKSKTIRDYTLSGTLTVGTSVITVAVENKTTTFNVTVEEYWTFEWNYTDGTPQNNGMTETSVGNNVTSMESDGYRLQSEDVSGKYIHYRYESLPTDVVYTNGTFEFEFKINAFGAYNVSPYGNGARFYTALGSRGGNMAYCPELIINESGLLYLSRTQSTPSATWTLLNNTPFVVNTWYKIKVELTETTATIYVNDSLYGTINDDCKEQISNSMFGAYRGIDITARRFRLKVFE